MRYRVGLADLGSSFSAFAFDLPGCSTNAPSREALLDVMPLVIADYVAWLGRGGVGLPDDEGVEIDVIEDVRAEDEAAVEGEFCFADDLRPVTGEEIEGGIRWMDRSRTDLLKAVRDLPDAVLDWRPPLSAMAQVDDWKPQPRTITEILADVASSEFYYRTGLRTGSIELEPDAELRDLALQRARLEAALRGLAGEDRGRRFEPVRSWQTAPEHWTARKVIRRVISHERFHTAEISQRLAWLLVGVPRFRRDQEEHR